MPDKTPKGKSYSKDEVKKILKDGGSTLERLKKKNNCWAVDLETLLSAGNSLRNAGKKEMRFFVTKDVPDKSPGDVIDPTTHLLFLETDSGCMEQFPPAEMP